jgi:RNA polymerase sigma-70 factor (ECF subfamily)
MADRDQIVAEIPRLRRYARALLGDTARADDLVQDTLERALSRWHLWRAGSNLRAWLFAIMHNLFVNQLKGAQRIEYVGDDPLPETAVRPEQADALEVLDLAAALQKLPPQQREVMLLVGLEELSYEEAAKALDVPIGTVMSRLSRGRERLRALLAGENARQLMIVK